MWGIEHNQAEDIEAKIQYGQRVGNNIMQADSNAEIDRFWGEENRQQSKINRHGL